MAYPMNPLTRTGSASLRPRSETHSSACSSTPQDATTSGLENAPYQPRAPTWLATDPSSPRTYETSSSAILGAPPDRSTVDNASSVTLHDEFPWHEVDIEKSKQRIPSAIVPALLQGVDNISPSSPNATSEEEEAVLGVDDDVPSHVGQTDMRYSIMEKGKQKARQEEGIMYDNPLAEPRAENHEFTFDGANNSVEDWVAHNTPILQDYANRQTSLPLGKRLEVSLDKPSQFISGGLQLLVNRDPKNCTNRSPQLGPQLIENFVDIHRWATEYFRSRHGMEAVDDDVPTLLTVITNNFYEAHVQLIDRLVEFAMENMRFCARSTLNVEDFAFGFDFRLSQDLPFYVESSSRIREPLPVSTVKPPSAQEPTITKSGRLVKPTKQSQAAAQAASEKKGGMGQKEIEKASPTTSSKAEKRLKAPVRRRGRNEGIVEPSHGGAILQTPSAAVYHTPNHGAVPSRTKPSVKTPAGLPMSIPHRPIQPSNLTLPPMIPDSLPTLPQTVPSQSNTECELNLSTFASVATPSAFNDPGLNLTVHVPRLKIVLPGLRAPAPTTKTSSDTAVLSSHAGSSSFSVFQSAVVPSQANATSSASGSSGHGGAPRARGTRQRCGRRGRGGGRGGAPRGTESASNSTPTTQPQVDPFAAGTTASIDVVGLGLPPAARTTLVDVLRRGVGATGVQPYGAHALTLAAIQATPTLSPGTSSLFSGHSIARSQGKKRKLGDCED